MRSGLWYSFGLVAGATLVILWNTIWKRTFFRMIGDY